MNNNYNELIKKIVLSSYQEFLIIDVMDDKVYKYENNNEQFNCTSETSYTEYLNECKKFIYDDDISSYIDSLSISKLEENNNKITINYRMLDNKIGSYMNYTNNVTIYNDNNKKIIVVLVSRNNAKHSEKANIQKVNADDKMNKLVEAVSLSMLKIHNVVNMDNNLRTKDEYINSILVSLTTSFPVLNKSFNENAGEVYNSGKTTIMIVDDDKMTCSLIAKIFSNDYDIIIANNGQEAIDVLNKAKQNETSISCIFLDLVMPVLDGFSVLEYLDENNYLMKMPVIIISGNYDKETRNRAYSYEIADMLEKPFNAQVIRHRIENLINLYRSSGILNEMMVEQHQSLKEVVSAIVTAYEMDNQKMINQIKKYMKILMMQVSVQYPEYNINSNLIEKIANSTAYFAIGNYTLPKTILYKKGEYTTTEKEIIKNANINGSSIVKYALTNNSEIDAQYAYEIARYFNERYEGNGYPEGLSANSIPLYAQIASLAIEYMNLANTIVPVDYAKIASLITMESGHKFNPKIVEAFKKVQSEFEAITKVGD